MPDQPPPNGAVFLSYASEDANAAARICETLRAAGIEVWFDRDELRGGDAWDSKIKKQIHDCALFVPVISAHTNARTEGYFRREWKLATRRLLDIADDAAFLVPVVIDDTRETDARVPEEFLGVQWTRVAGGEAAPAFAQRVRQLLAPGPVPAAPRSATPHDSIRAPTRRTGLPHLRRAGAALGAMLVLGGGIWWYYLSSSDAPGTVPAVDTASLVLAAVPHEKSIAVLPFVDMSEEKNQEYMSDGLAEELLNLLAQVPDLKVIARTSSFAFKGQNVDIAEIAKRLNVAHVMEGSIRTSGGKLRVSAQLIRTADSARLWSQRYDRPLDDIFAVQDEIANDIVQALQVRIRGSTLSRPKGGTDDLEAYQLYLQAVNAFNVSTGASLDEAEELLKRAIELDPNYGRAWSRLGWVAYTKSITGDKSAIEAYEEARQYAKRALELSPQLADAHALLQVIYVQADKDWAAAESAGRKALALDPTNSEVLFSAGWFASVQGRYEEGERMYRRALDRDPLNYNLVDGIAENYYRTGRLTDAEGILRAHIEREPRSAWSRAILSRVLLAQGRPDAALAMLQEEIDEGARIAYLPIMLQGVGRRAESDAAMKEQIAYWAEGCALCIARACAYRGDNDLALEWLERAYRQKDSSIMNILDEPLLGSLPDDPRYQAFVREKLKVQAREPQAG